MRSVIILIAAVALMGCATLDPGASVDLDNYSATVGTKYASVTASTTGASLDTTEFTAGVVVCFKEGGVVNRVLGNLGSLGSIVQKIVACRS